ncbi:uncharacterized protein [Typha angustifolia]|uniref:uncharacterized protein n=1 Tax=Typha angustifolia TaxID=59011 RepID=UPI003C2C4BD7
MGSASNDPPRTPVAEGGGGGGEKSRSQDAAWFSSLSEPELDFLISLKEMATMRAKNIGYSGLAEKFDARTLRALGIILLDFFKERVKSTSSDPKLVETLDLLSDCGLAALDHEGKPYSAAHSEDVSASNFATPRRKRMWEGLCEERVQSCKKQKTTENKM